MRVFDNPDVLPSTWYALLPSRALRPGQVRKATLFDRSIAVFRGQDGIVRALDDRCPHLGADLSRGSVVGNELRCEMHHWRYDASGRCSGRPSGAPIPPWARTFAYPVEERHGFVWVWNGERPAFPVPCFDREESLHTEILPEATFSCHAHVATLNGLDAEHMAPVHGMAHRVPPRLVEVAPYRLEMRYELRFLGSATRDRIARWLTNDTFRLRFTTWGGNTSMGEVEHERFAFSMLFNHVPLPGGGTVVKPFLLLPRSRRWGGRPNPLKRPFVDFLADYFLIPDLAVLDAMRFQLRLTEGDEPLRAFVRGVERLEIFDPRRKEAA